MSDSSSSRIATLETEVERLRQEVERLRVALRVDDGVFAKVELTPQLLEVYRVLKRQGHATYGQLVARMEAKYDIEYKEPINIIRVAVSKLRARGFGVKTMSSYGYRLVSEPEGEQQDGK